MVFKKKDAVVKEKKAEATQEASPSQSLQEKPTAEDVVQSIPLSKEQHADLQTLLSGGRAELVPQVPGPTGLLLTERQWKDLDNLIASVPGLTVEKFINNALAVGFHELSQSNQQRMVQQAQDMALIMKKPGSAVPFR